MSESTKKPAIYSAIYNEEELATFGQELAGSLVPGTVLALTGDLGAGKTTLTKAIAAGLGITEPVTSPTFTIIKEYDSGRLPLYHFDVYRIDEPDEMYELGYETYFFGDGVSVVEWADKIEDLIPKDAIRFELSYGSKDGERILTKMQGEI